MAYIALLSDPFSIPISVGVQKTTVQFLLLASEQVRAVSIVTQVGLVKNFDFNLPTSRFLLKRRYTKGFRTGGVSLTPPVEVPSNPPSEVQTIVRDTMR